MIAKKDVEILSLLRRDARRKVTHMSRILNTPATTVYDRIRCVEKKGIVKKHVSLLDFSKIGYGASIMIAFKVAKTQKEEFEKYLSANINLNSLYKIDAGSDYLAEFIFENMLQCHDFLDATENKFAVEKQIFTIIQEIKKEQFLA